VREGQATAASARGPGHGG